MSRSTFLRLCVRAPRTRISAVPRSLTGRSSRWRGRLIVASVEAGIGDKRRTEHDNGARLAGASRRLAPLRAAGAPAPRAAARPRPACSVACQCSATAPTISTRAVVPSRRTTAAGRPSTSSRSALVPCFSASAPACWREVGDTSPARAAASRSASQSRHAGSTAVAPPLAVGASSACAVAGERRRAAARAARRGAIATHAACLLLAARASAGRGEGIGLVRSRLGDRALAHDGVAEGRGGVARRRGRPLALSAAGARRGPLRAAAVRRGVGAVRRGEGAGEVAGAGVRSRLPSSRPGRCLGRGPGRALELGRRESRGRVVLAQRAALLRRRVVFRPRALGVGGVADLGFARRCDARRRRRRSGVGAGGAAAGARACRSERARRRRRRGRRRRDAWRLASSRAPADAARSRPSAGPTTSGRPASPP